MKRFMILAGCFLFGVLLSATSMYFLFEKFAVFEKKTEFKSQIMRPYSILFQLRQNKPDTAVEVLEGELDSALFSLAYGLENKFYQMDSATRLILDKVREYRKTYPRNYTDEEYKRKIEKLLE